jgi:hypothetical protein
MYVVSILLLFLISVKYLLLDAENAINHTMIGVYINVDDQTNINMTCDSLKSCNNRGQCIIVDNQLKCLYVLKDVFNFLKENHLSFFD